jgi:hypothetical protein
VDRGGRAQGVHDGGSANRATTCVIVSVCNGVDRGRRARDVRRERGGGSGVSCLCHPPQLP